ncbi:MarR family winged helix-turn-helix transcriptional regulator [Catellatospora vulcania]|uniref:MarR family winged helix-turn-helix transcriptional regulator n=1 Tax=Catellatospora vulcania TaxID=1460450 RepID=UPI0012D3AE91|nr:MarR family transcriptional regulator [Catellatospora vulcania]
MPAPAPHGPTPDLLQLLTNAERLLQRRLSAILRAEQCSPEAWRVLTLLAAEGGRPMTEVADGAFLPPGTLTKVVDQLAEHSLVYRRVDPLDRRRIRAYLSPRGRQLHDRIADRVRASIGELAMPEFEREQLAALLSTLTDALSRHPAVA